MERNSKFSLWKIGAENATVISHTTKSCSVAKVEINLCWLEGFDF